MASIGLCGLAVMGQVGHPESAACDRSLCMAVITFVFLQNLALNIADKGFSISVYNRTYSKTEAAVTRAKKESRVCQLADRCFGLCASCCGV